MENLSTYALTHKKDTSLLVLSVLHFNSIFSNQYAVDLDRIYPNITFLHKMLKCHCVLSLNLSNIILCPLNVSGLKIVNQTIFIFAWS